MFENFLNGDHQWLMSKMSKAQDIQNEQQTEQTQAEGVEQANELSVEI